MSDPAAALARARAESPFLARQLDRFPDIAAVLAGGDWDAALAGVPALGLGGDLATALRRERAALSLIVAIADLAGAWDLTRVTATLSDFADGALDRAIAAAIAERAPDAAPAGFAAIALGKHGGRELNYSSDIDPIFLYDPDLLPRRRSEEPGEAAVRIGRRVVALLAEPTAQGFVFRVDLRLRPTPEVSPVAIPVGGAIHHYESSAEAWEQAAFIRARAAAGDRALGVGFLDTIQPFIWRRSLDFGQIAAIGAMTAAIRDHFHAGQAFGLGYDLKRGRGGIREVEFYAQAHQLIHGGRDPALRVADTRAALAALAAAGHVAPGDAAILTAAYVRLRTVEHRLQMVADRQTHSLPGDAAALDSLARLDGLADGAALLASLAPAVAAVGEIYDRLTDVEAGERLPRDAGALTAQLGEMGFADPADPARRIARWRAGDLRATRSAAAREAFERVLPPLLAALAAAPDPALALARLDNLIAALPSGLNLFRLIEARPALGTEIGDVLSYAPVLAEELGRRPALLDGLIDASVRDLPGDVAALAARMRRRATSYEALLDEVRAVVGEQRFALGVQLVEGAHDPLAIAAGYARLAEAAVGVLADATIAEFARTHGRVPGSELVIVALGRLGGGALTHASDLDLVYLFTGDHRATSDGQRPLGATDYFNRLAARISAALSAPTAAGALYPVDTRLRPSGAKGLLAVSVDTFSAYQEEAAWDFEHMALTRARVVFGSAAARATVDAIITRTLTRSRDPVALAGVIAAMRREMATHKPPAGLMDVKLLPGGLVDVEFIVHHAQLTTHVGLEPDLTRAIAALTLANILPADLRDAHAMLARVLMLTRLVAPDSAPPPAPARALLARNLHQADWPALMDALDAARTFVKGLFERQLGQAMEEPADE